jgi:D-inositol-3-phosphate glycosyltransferase
LIFLKGKVFMVSGNIRIAMLSVHSCPVGNLGAKDTGGMSVYVRELAGELGRMGISVDIYTRVHDPRDSQVVELGENVRLIHIKAGEGGDIGKLAVYSYLPEFARNLEEFRRLNKLQYNLIFSHYWLSGEVGQYLQDWWDAPHVMMYHTLGVVKNTIGIGEVEPELRIESERQLARNCHHIIATTEKEKEDLIWHYGASPERIGVVPCGVNLDLFRPGDKAMAKRKLRLVIIGGDGNSRKEIDRLRKLSHYLGIEDSVTFMGLVKHEELTDYYNAASLFVMPSHYETFGLVALEALACGTPVVAMDVGDLKSIIGQGETGYVVEDNTPSGLADKIALLISCPGIKSAQEIRASVSRFGWPNIAEQVYREVLSDYLAPVVSCCDLV